MIGRIQGVVVEKNFPQVIVSCQGVGYEIDVPMSTFYPLPALGQEVTLLTHLVVREDAHLLFGFLTAPERAAFRQLLKISGVGPKVALAVLSDSVWALVAGSASERLRGSRRFLSVQRYVSGSVFVGLGALTASAKRY